MASTKEGADPVSGMLTNTFLLCSIFFPKDIDIYWTKPTELLLFTHSSYSLCVGYLTSKGRIFLEAKSTLRALRAALEQYL